jgi:excinuclease ABC subunit C
MLIQKIRDEAHRFAITFNRESRNKAMKKNILEELPGFGPKTRSKLLKLAGSVDAIKNHDEKELLTVISHKQLEILRDH